MQFQTKDVSRKSQALIDKILNKMQGLNKSRKLFFSSCLLLFLSLRGRYNFLGMERYGDYNEKSYRLQFEKDFDFLQFNLLLAQAELSNNLIIGFDPSYLPKSGKHTPHKGKFWSGCTGKSIEGIEIGCIGVIDLDNNTAFNLESIQTPNASELEKDHQTLVDYYTSLLVARAADLVKISSYLVVDGYFYKKKFVDGITEQTQLKLISKLRKDANLRFLYQGPKREGRGRPKKYEGKVNIKNIDYKKFKKIAQTEDEIIFEAIVWSVSLKRKIKVSYVEYLKQGKSINRYSLFFSTDLNINGLTIYQYYKARFQIEFLFRDAKQFTGLSHCQARSENKIYFHTNLSLTAIGVAKIAHYYPKKSNKYTYSISNVKTVYFNELMLNLFFSNFQISDELKKNNEVMRKVMNFGKIAA